MGKLYGVDVQISMQNYTTLKFNGYDLSYRG